MPGVLAPPAGMNAAGMMNSMMNPGMMNPMGYPMGMPNAGGVMFPNPMDMGSGYNPYMMPFAQMPMFGSGSAASFHMPGPKNEIKLFVGGLQF